MIEAKTIDNILFELQDSYLIPIDKNPSKLVQNYNRVLINTIKDLIKLRLYFKDVKYTL